MRKKDEDYLFDEEEDVSEELENGDSEKPRLRRQRAGGSTLRAGGTSRRGHGDDDALSKYYAPSSKEISRKQKELERRKGKYYTLAEGQNFLRILPPFSSSRQFYVEVPTHWYNKQRAICRKLIGKRCPGCEKQQEWSSSKDPIQQKKSASINLNYDVFFNVIDCKNPQNGVQVWRTSDTMLYKILGFYNDPDYGNFTNPNKGFDLIVVREGSGMRTRYTDVRLRRKSSPIPYEDWQKELVDLSKMADVKDYDETARQLFTPRQQKPEDE